MGEIADMMLDGTLCQGCGEYLDGETPDHPRFCNACMRGELRHMADHLSRGEKSIRNQLKMNCPTCQKRVKTAGLRDHMRDAHGVKS